VSQEGRAGQRRAEGVEQGRAELRWWSSEPGQGRAE